MKLTRTNIEPITDPKELLEQNIGEETRAIFRQQLGQLRSIASRMKATGLVQDEEIAFNDLLSSFTGNFSNEICKLVGTETAVTLLDPFHGKST